MPTGTNDNASTAAAASRPAPKGPRTQTTSHSLVRPNRERPTSQTAHRNDRKRHGQGSEETTRLRGRKLIPFPHVALVGNEALALAALWRQLATEFDSARGRGREVVGAPGAWAEIGRRGSRVCAVISNDVVEELL